MTVRYCSCLDWHDQYDAAGWCELCGGMRTDQRTEPAEFVPTHLYDECS